MTNKHTIIQDLNTRYIKWPCAICSNFVSKRYWIYSQKREQIKIFSTCTSVGPLSDTDQYQNWIHLKSADSLLTLNILKEHLEKADNNESFRAAAVIQNLIRSRMTYNPYTSGMPSRIDFWIWMWVDLFGGLTSKQLLGFTSLASFVMFLSWCHFTGDISKSYSLY